MIYYPTSTVAPGLFMINNNTIRVGTVIDLTSFESETLGELIDLFRELEAGRATLYQHIFANQAQGRDFSAELHSEFLEHVNVFNNMQAGQNLLTMEICKRLGGFIPLQVNYQDQNIVVRERQEGEPLALTVDSVSRDSGFSVRSIGVAALAGACGFDPWFNYPEWSAHGSSFFQARTAGWISDNPALSAASFSVMLGNMMQSPMMKGVQPNQIPVMGGILTRSSIRIINLTNIEKALTGSALDGQMHLLRGHMVEMNPNNVLGWFIVRYTQLTNPEDPNEKINGFLVSYIDVLHNNQMSAYGLRYDAADAAAPVTPAYTYDNLGPAVPATTLLRLVDQAIAEYEAGLPPAPQEAPAQDTEAEVTAEVEEVTEEPVAVDTDAADPEPMGEVDEETR